MKKLVFSVIVAMILIVSGITAVGAYEGHMVDVKAHVENALMVDRSELDFGTTFPEEALEGEINVGLSESFRLQERYSSVEYNVYWEPKAIEQGYTEDATNPGYFTPIYPFIVLRAEGDTVISPLQAGPNGTMLAGQGTLYSSDDNCDTWHLRFDPPVFRGWYNALTDPRTPSGILEVGEFYTTTETAACGFTATVPHVDLGSNLKIQVTDVVLHNE